MTSIRSRVATALVLTSLASHVIADVQITEIMFNSTHPPISPDHNYWWKLTNCGATSVDLLNYSWDDNTPIAGAFVFPSVVLQPGESLVIVERPDITSAMSDFRSAWGLPSSCKVLSAVEFGESAFPGFGMNGQLTLFDPSGAPVDSYLGGLNPPDGTSIWRECGGEWSQTILGENCAYQAPGVDPGDIASPCDCITPIPTASTWGLVAMSLLILSAGTLVFRRTPAALIRD